MSTNSDLPDGFSATEYPDNLQQRSEFRPDGPEARAVDDPHSWDRSGPSLVERVTPDTTSGWLAAFGVGLILFGILYFTVPVFIGFVTNPLVLGGLAFLAYSGVVLIIGRKWMWSNFRQMDKNVVSYGDEADIRFGEGDGVEGRSNVFIPYTDLRFWGLRPVPLQKDQLPYDAEKMKQTAPDSKDAVHDLLNQHTTEVNTDTFGTFYVTHANDLEYYEHGEVADRYATPPRTIDEDVADKFRLQLQELKSKLQEYDQRIEMLEQANAELRDLRESETIPQLEQSIDIVEDLMEMTAQQKRGGGTSRDEIIQSARNGDSE